MFKLCHKCQGILERTQDADKTGLYVCGCISGWIRGTEPTLNRKEAIECQVYGTLRKARLYAEQGRPNHDNILERLRQLEQLAKSEGIDL